MYFMNRRNNQSSNENGDNGPRNRQNRSRSDQTPEQIFDQNITRMLAIYFISFIYCSMLSLEIDDDYFMI